MSPLRKVDELGVPLNPNLPIGTVPDVRLEAFNDALPPLLTPAAVALAKNSALDMFARSALAKFIPPVFVPSYNRKEFAIRS